MRSHGRVPKEPWEYGDKAVANYKYYAWVRENLLDYIYHSVIESHLSGIPMVRAMAVAFPEELSVVNIPDQYMFGKDLMGMLLDRLGIAVRTGHHCAQPLMQDLSRP